MTSIGSTAGVRLVPTPLCVYIEAETALHSHCAENEIILDDDTTPPGESSHKPERAGSSRHRPQRHDIPNERMRTSTCDKARGSTGPQ